MNKKNVFRKKITAAAAFGMAGIMGATPVCAAGGETTGTEVTKEETVYVNAAADGSEQQIIVSDWLKNPGKDDVLADRSDLSDMKNVKGDEPFENKDGEVTWKAEGNDIYYQGTSEKELPVSLQFHYYLDGKETDPKELKGKRGQLRIRIDYTNHANRTATIDGKSENVYSPFVMVTGLILPEETFSNVVIDNGKVVSDGQRNLVLGFAMPGLKESLGLEKEEGEAVLGNLHLPESLEITADVENFTMEPTFTVALSDMLEDLQFDDTSDMEGLLSSLNELEDAALQLVDGSAALFDGVSQYTDGADQLHKAIQQYLGDGGEMDVKVTEYVDGVNSLVKGAEEYVGGTNRLADGITAYVNGEEQIAAGAKELAALQDGLGDVKKAIGALSEALDGDGEPTKDLYMASEALAAGTKRLNDGLQSMSELLGKVDTLTTEGKALTKQAGELGNTLQDQLLQPAEETLKLGGNIIKQLEEISAYLDTVTAICETAVQKANAQAAEELNGKIREKNEKIQEIEKQVAASNEKIGKAEANLRAQIGKANEEGNVELATSLSETAALLSEAKGNTASIGVLEEVQPPKTEVTIPAPEFTGLEENMTAFSETIQTIGTTAGGLMPQLETMTGKLEQLAKVSGELEKVPQMDALKQNVSYLNEQMQAFHKAIGSLSENVGALDRQTDALPEAAKGIGALLKGMEELTANNQALKEGAGQLKDSGPKLVSGVEELSGGTRLLQDGIATLGSSLLGGTGTLSGNSAALRAGAEDLKNGMGKFKKDGIQTLTDTAEEMLGTVVDRVNALTSDDCRYDTYGGKADGMEGSVKFVIETEGIE